MNKKKLLLKTLEWALFGVIFLVFVVMLSPLLPTKNSIGSYAVVSGSMQPTVMTGSIAFIKHVQPNSLHKDDIIAFSEPGNPRTTILHRIYATEKTNNNLSFITKGDANNAIDKWRVSSQEVKGAYLFAVPYLGYLSIYVREPVGFLIIVGIPALLLIILQLKMVKDGVESEVRKRIKKAQKKVSDPQFFKIELILFLAVGSLIFIPHVFSMLNAMTSMNGITIQTKPTFADLDATYSGHTVILNFSNLAGYSHVSYDLEYQTDTVKQDVEGQSVLDGSSFQKSITLGTCSTNNVCTYDKNPHDFTLTIILTDNHSKDVTIVKHF